MRGYNLGNWEASDESFTQISSQEKSFFHHFHHFLSLSSPGCRSYAEVAASPSPAMAGNQPAGGLGRPGLPPPLPPRPLRRPQCCSTGVPGRGPGWPPSLPLRDLALVRQRLQLRYRSPRRVLWRSLSCWGPLRPRMSTTRPHLQVTLRSNQWRTVKWRVRIGQEENESFRRGSLETTG